MVTVADCSFCKRLEAGDYDQDLSDEGWMAVFEPLSPVTPGHLLVVPWHHCADAAADPDCAKYAMAHAASLLRREGITAANLITSVGSEATQTVFHLHVHIVPRRAGDLLALPWTGHRDHPVTSPAYPSLTDPERDAIASLQRLAKHWPASLKLISMDGGLSVIRTADAGFVTGFAPNTERQDRILADIDDIPNDGGSW